MILLSRYYTAKVETTMNYQKQPPRDVLNKRCSENMQQIYRRTPMPKCDFNKVSWKIGKDEQEKSLPHHQQESNKKGCAVKFTER